MKIIFLQITAAIKKCPSEIGRSITPRYHLINAAEKPHHSQACNVAHTVQSYRKFHHPVRSGEKCRRQKPDPDLSFRDSLCRFASCRAGSITAFENTMIE